MRHDLPQIRLGYEHVAHGQHAQAAQLFGSVENNGWETARHFRVQPDLDTGLNLVLTLDQQIQQLLCVYYCFTEVGHQANKSRVPFVHNLEAEINGRL